ASTFDEVFEGVKALPWEDFLPQNAVFPVSGTSFDSQLTSVPALQGVVKKAAVEAMRRRYHVDIFPENGPSYSIKFTLVRDLCTVLLDTSGSGLHRRGYRQATAEAPLRETLAAGLVQLSYWNAGRPLFDPFCGSATILIEAAMIGLRRAPGLRRKFASEEWDFVGQRNWQEARQDAEDQFDRTTKLSLFGSDIDPHVLQLANHNIVRAQLHERGIQLQARPAREFRSHAEFGVMITNPPYGERQSNARDVEELYTDLGKTMSHLRSWSIYVITSYQGFERAVGVKAGRKRKLYNGALQCTYFQYPGPKPPSVQR
ncbi:unnamed protein product, partial [Phaeothamnion confervicola]